MPRITVLPKGITLEAKPNQCLLDLLDWNDVPILRDCGGNLACGTCQVLELTTGCLDPVSDIEEETLECYVWDRQPKSRLACVAKIVNDGEILVVREYE